MRLNNEHAPENRFFTKDGNLSEFAVSEYARLRLDDREADMPEEVLSKIMSDAQTADRVILKVRQYRAIRKQKRKTALRRVYSAAAAVALLAAVGMAFYLFNPGQTTDEHAQIAAHEDANSKTHPVPHSNEQEIDHVKQENQTATALSSPLKDDDSPEIIRLAPLQTQAISEENHALNVDAVSSGTASDAQISERKKLMAFQENRFGFEEARIFENGLTAFESGVRSAGSAPAASEASRNVQHAPARNAAVWDQDLVFTWKARQKTPGAKDRYRITIKQKGEPNRHIYCDEPPCKPSESMQESMRPGLYYWDVHDAELDENIVSDKFKYYRSDIRAIPDERP